MQSSLWYSVPYFLIHLLGNQYNMFSMEKLTGEIKVRMAIDPSMEGYYRLGVGVHDNGQPPRTVLSNVGIQITKVCEWCDGMGYKQWVSTCRYYKRWPSFTNHLPMVIVIQTMKIQFLNHLIDGFNARVSLAYKYPVFESLGLFPLSYQSCNFISYSF